MGEFVTIVILVSLAVGGGYYMVTTAYKRAVARNRSDSWRKQLRRMGETLPLANEAPFELRHGEEFVMNLKNQSLVEPRRGTRVSTRSTDAFTVALAKGFYYTAASGSSVSPEPDEEMKQIDTGTATFTTHRVVFVGSRQTREWDFAKLLGTSEASGGIRPMIAVSNRQKMSGLASASLSQISPGMAFQITTLARDEGFDAARTMCVNGAREIEAQMAVTNQSFFITESSIADQMETWREKNRPPEADPAQDAKAEAPAKAAKAEPPPPLKEIQVVGEFFYKKSFAALREELKSEGNSEHILEAELRVDPDNEYSDSGKAVAVYIRNKQVGHVPEWLAPTVFDALEPDGGKVTLGARLWMDDINAKPQKNSVTVMLDSRLVLI